MPCGTVLLVKQAFNEKRGALRHEKMTRAIRIVRAYANEDKRRYCLPYGISGIVKHMYNAVRRDVCYWQADLAAEMAAAAAKEAAIERRAAISEEERLRAVAEQPTPAEGTRASLLRPAPVQFPARACVPFARRAPQPQTRTGERQHRRRVAAGVRAARRQAAAGRAARRRATPASRARATARATHAGPTPAWSSTTASIQRASVD